MNEEFLSGRVQIIDNHTGEVVRDVHNMIVATGRKAILDAIVDTKMTVNITGIYASTNPSQTISSLTYDQEDENFYGTATPIASTPTTVTSVDRPYAIYEIELNKISTNNQNQKHVVYAVGLIAQTKKGDDSSNNILFSRATFEPIFITENSSFKIKYYLYI